MLSHSHWSRCRAALQSGSSELQVEEVILPDGEQYKSLEVLQRVTLLTCHMLACKAPGTYLACLPVLSVPS